VEIQHVGRILLITGVVIAVAGGLMLLAGRAGIRLGQLPGDIRIEGQGFSCLIPIVSSILLSILLTVVLNLIIRFLNRP